MNTISKTMTIDARVVGAAIHSRSTAGGGGAQGAGEAA